MDSFVLAETFKYLYLLFSEKEHHIIDVDDFVFTTEAHLLPLSLSVGNYSWRGVNKVVTLLYPSLCFCLCKTLAVCDHYQLSNT